MRLNHLLILVLALGLISCTPRRGGGGSGDDDDDDDSGMDDDDDNGDDDDLFNPDDDDDSQPDDDDTIPTPDDDDIVEDDDDFSDDDDSFPTDDDDVTPPPSTACNGAPQFESESEPNDDPDAGEVNDFGASQAESITITGSFSNCANDGKQWTGDRDYFVVDMECTGDLTAELSWDGTTTDADFNVIAPAIDPANFLLAGYTFGMDSPELDGPAEAGGELLIGVLCWEGPGTDWELTLTFD